MDSKTQRVALCINGRKIDVKGRASAQTALHGYRPHPAIEAANRFNVVLITGTGAVVVKELPIDDAASQCLRSHFIELRLLKLTDIYDVGQWTIGNQLMLQDASIHLANGLDENRVPNGVFNNQADTIIEKKKPLLRLGSKTKDGSFTVCV